jgi:hypothetical protein
MFRIGDRSFQVATNRMDSWQSIMAYHETRSILQQRLQQGSIHFDEHKKAMQSIHGDLKALRREANVSVWIPLRRRCLAREHRNTWPRKGNGGQYPCSIKLIDYPGDIRSLGLLTCRLRCQLFAEQLKRKLERFISSANREKPYCFRYS